MVLNGELPVDLSRSLTDDDWRSVTRWNDTRADYPRERCIHEIFEDQAARTPDALALISEDGALTYRELNARANQLARYLRQHGVIAESLVGVCLDRSFDLLVALLGVLKAGGAYVPLDPSYPLARLAFMLNDSRASILLTRDRLRAALPPTSAHIVYVDCDEAIEQQSPENVETIVSAENLAYAIYTSGSTGQPKGVLGCHRAAVNRFSWMWRVYPFGPREVSCQKTALSFVDSVWETFGPLLAGVPSVLVPDDVVRDPDRFVEMLATHQVTRIVVVPSYLRVLLDTSPDLAASLPHLKLWTTSGESISVELCGRFLAQMPRRTLLNLYGSSEVSADATCYEVRAEDFSASVPIGRAIANTDLYILDEQRRPVPLGDVGELYVGGDCLARGYLNRPELTAERFVVHPFRTEPSALLFRTGDQARYRPDGNLEFVGRVDQQVKIRGYRIELGEVEATLRQNAAVRDVVVVVRRDRPDDPRLAAYIVPQPDRGLAVRELRRFVSERLPTYMIPGSFTLLDALPLLPNGKVDRHTLPPPGSVPSAPLPTDRPLTSETEKKIARIWSEVLGIDRVSAEEGFFEVGGDSLSATRVVSRIDQIFHTDLPLSAFFDRPTIASLAEFVDSRAILTPDGHRRSIPRLTRTGTAPISIGQETVWFLDQVRPGVAYLNLPTALRFVGLLDQSAIRQALSAIVRRHDVLRTRFARIEGRPVPVVDAVRPMLVSELDLSDVSESDRASQAQAYLNEEASRPFDLAQNWPIRVMLVTLGDEDHILLVTVHHIASDGWSGGLLLQELFALYAAFVRGESSPLPDLPIRYADFAEWQRDRLRGELLDRRVAFWKNELRGDLPEWLLPTDRSRDAVLVPDILYFRSDRVPIEISPTLESGLRALSRREGVTSFMTLLAAFGALLYQWSGHEDIVVGTPAAGRTHSDLESLIGFFSNTLPLRMNLSGNPTFRDLLGRVREMAAGAYSNQDLPPFKLVEALHPTRDPVSAPLYSVMFNHENTSLPSLDIPELRVSPVEVTTGVNLLELDVELYERSDGLHGFFEYATELFDRETIVDLACRYRAILESVAVDPDQPLSAFAPSTRGNVLQPPTRVPPVQAVDSPPEFQPPADDLERILVRIWQDVLGTRSVGVRDNFFHLGGHSLLAIQVLARVEDAVGVKLPAATFFWAPTIASLAEILRQKGWRPRWSSLVPVQASGSRIPFFCVHGFGGGVLDYADLARELGPDQPFYGLQALGRDSDEQPHDNIETMASYYLDEIRLVQPEGPYCLGGYCAGATIAFEMARQLVSIGETVSLLAVIEGEAPKSFYRTFAGGARSILGFCANLPYWLVDYGHLKPHQMRARLGRDLRFALRRRAGFTTSSPWPDWLIASELVDDLAEIPEEVLNVIVTHQHAFIKYWPRPFSGRVTLFRVRRHPLFSSYDPAKGWGSLAAGGVDVQLIDGAHHTVLMQPYVRSLGARLRACLG